MINLNYPAHESVDFVSRKFSKRNPSFCGRDFHYFLIIARINNFEKYVSGDTDVKWLKDGQRSEAFKY